jgi:hypothetical protein
MLQPIGFSDSEPFVIVPGWALRAAEVFKATNDYRYYLQGICLMKDGRIVGTDGKTMFVYQSDFSLPENKIIKLSEKIPVRANEIRVSFFIEGRHQKARLKLYHYKPRDHFLTLSKVITADVIDAQFPNIDRIVEQSSEGSESSGPVRLNPMYLARAEKAFPGSDRCCHGVICQSTGQEGCYVIKPAQKDYEGATIYIMPMRMD